MADYVIVNGELYHHGVKGMKWGRRRWQNADGSLTPAGVKRYAKAGYAQDAYNSNKTILGKAYDKYTGAHKYQADFKYSSSSKKANEARANKYLADKDNRSDMRKDFDAKKDAYKAANKEYNKAFDKAYNKAHQAYSLSKKKREANDQRWEEAFDKAEALREAKGAYKDAKKARKGAIKDAHADIRKQASFTDKLIYNDATRKQAAKYVVDRNMTMEEATKKANADARRNTAIFMAAYAGIMVGTTYMSKR